MNQQPITIKIPFKAASVLVTKRKRRGNHVVKGKALNTNRMEKWFGFYFACKALTTSGVIHNFNAQMDLLKLVTNRTSCATIYSYVNNCVRLGLMQKKGNDIHLVSWEKCIAKLGLNPKESLQFIEFYYEKPQHIKASPEYHIEAAEIAEGSHFSLKAIAKKINQNVQLKRILGIKPEVSATTEDAKRLFNYQLDSFITGKIGDLATSEDDYQLLHSVNACPYRNSLSMVQARVQGTLKSTKAHIARLKRKLFETGLAVVQELTCYSIARKRANSAFFYRGWDKNKNCAVWYLPTEVDVLAKFV